jgi:hypothetical protein
MDAPAMNARLDAIRHTGATWVRFDLAWATVQRNGSDAWDWSMYDTVVGAVAAHGLRSLPILDYTPGWARRDGCTDLKCEPKDAAAFGRFAGAAVRRYSPAGVTTWEIWNEPNLAQSWQPAANADAYGRLLRAASDAIRATGQPAAVLLGGLGPTVTNGRDIAPVDFVRRVYEVAGAHSFDGIAMHPYSFPALPTEAAQWTGWSQMRRVRALMVARGDASKKVWITEFGAPTNGAGALATLESRRYDQQPDHVDEDLQRRTAELGVSQAIGTQWINAFFWYGYQDLGVNRADNEDFFGVVRPDGSFKPAYQALRQAFLNGT